ncbi:hypothetical protein ACFYWH_20050 [Streptomyces sp. NPDC003737]|uniref:hypothetical protein n=1 Tax=Streptomyces sp. NPDC003737 TaxID=3364685 RepID=UPI0036B4B69A
MHGDQVRFLQAALDYPLGRWRPHLVGLLVPCRALLFLRDPGVDLRYGGRGLLDDDAACEVEKIESGRRGVVHLFDITA